jgi:hypothetical protein
MCSGTWQHVFLSFTMQSYDIRSGQSGDGRGWRAMAKHYVSGFTQLCDYGADLSWREGFAGGVVAGLLEFVPEGCAAANPRHEVVDGCTRVAAGEVQEGKLLLGVRPDRKFTIHSSYNFEFINFEF